MPVFNYISNLIDDPDPVIVMPLGGFANDKMIHAQARVLEDEGIRHAEENSLLTNLSNSYKRFESDEKRDALVKVIWGNHEQLLTSDREGYIYLDVPHKMKLTHHETLWIPVTYQLLEGDKIIYEVTASVMKPSRNVEFGIISDIDDTLIHTGVSSFLRWKVVVNSFMKQSDSRLPLDGAQHFYQLLNKGQSGYNDNPFFYLSNSPWNIYDYLEAFLKKFDFPSGTLLLRDIGLENKRVTSFMEGNKYKKILHILQTYPEVPFILIGDAGEIDTDIYLKIAQTFPERILAIYIRAVNKKSKLKRIQKLIETYTNIEVAIISDSEQAIAHAKAKGFI